MDDDVKPSAVDGSALFGGPPAYVVDTKWGPWLGLLAAVLIMGLSIVVAIVLIQAGLVAGKTRSGDSLGLGLLAVWQAGVVVLTLCAALWGGWRGTLALGPPRGGLKTYAQAVGLLLLLQGVGTLGEYVFVRDQMLRDLRPFADVAMGPYWHFGLLVVAVGAPLSEEFLFRGFLFSALAHSRLRIIGAALITTLFWTTLHAGYGIVGLVEIFLVGLYFSWLLWRTGSLRVTIVCHAVYNGLIMLVLHFVALPAPT